MLRTITANELKIILDNHRLWLNDDSTGVRANLSFANLHSADLSSAVTDKRYLQVTCIGSRKGTTTYCFDDDFIWCGCWQGKMIDFEKRVKETHYGGGPQFLK